MKSNALSLEKLNTFTSLRPPEVHVLLWTIMYCIGNDYKVKMYSLFFCKIAFDTYFVSNCLQFLAFITWKCILNIFVFNKLGNKLQNPNLLVHYVSNWRNPFRNCQPYKTTISDRCLSNCCHTVPLIH